MKIENSLPKKFVEEVFFPYLWAEFYNSFPRMNESKDPFVKLLYKIWDQCISDMQKAYKTACSRETDLIKMRIELEEDE